MSVESAVGCPECRRQLPTDRRYAIWCQHCGWNLDPEPVAEQPGWQAERERRLADDLAERPASGPERSLSAFLLSLPVLLVPLPCLLGGLALLVFYRPLWFAVPFAAVAFTLSATFRPRIRRLPEDAQPVTRQQAPPLYAVLAHALYDDQRGLHDRVLGAAQHILGELAAAVTPGALDTAEDWTIERSEGVDYRVGRGSTDHVLHDRLTQLANAVLGPPIRGYRRLLRRLDLVGRQRREYRIDRRVAELVGSEPAARSLERVLLAGICQRALERAVRFGRDGDPLEALRRTANEIPEHEFARLVLVDRARNGRNGADHPPTWQRTRLLRAHPAPVTTVPAPANDDELAAAGRAAAANLHDHS